MSSERDDLEVIGSFTWKSFPNSKFFATRHFEESFT